MHNVVGRYIVATEGPFRLWMEWVNLKDKTLATVLHRLEEIQAVVKQPKVQRVVEHVRKLEGNFQELVQRYDSKFREFRDVDEWTPELLRTVKQLAADRDLRKRLKVDDSVDGDLVGEGVQEYFDDLTSKDPSANDVQRVVETLYAYAEGKKSLAQAETALKTLPVTFTQQEAGLRAVYPLIPELKAAWGDSYREFQVWVKALEEALDRPDALLSVLEPWEDKIPVWFGGYEDASTYLDVSFVEGRSSILYRYAVDFQRLSTLVGSAAKHRLDG